MPHTIYPTFLKQCAPTSRNNVTQVLSEVSQNGVIRGRVMHTEPTYSVTLTHSGMNDKDVNMWDAWWKVHKGDTIEFTWVPDNGSYVGIFQDPPALEFDAQGSYRNFTLTVNLLCKKKSATTVSYAIAATPGSFYPKDAGIPSNLAALVALGAFGNTRAWKTGEYIVLGDASEAYWDSSAWQAGRAP